jgi:hypothetical protein
MARLVVRAIYRGAAGTAVMAGAGPPSKPLFYKGKTWLPTAAGMMARRGR